MLASAHGRDALVVRRLANILIHVARHDAFASNTAATMLLRLPTHLQNISYSVPKSLRYLITSEAKCESAHKTSSEHSGKAPSHAGHARKAETNTLHV
jgi:hypothetical protein